MKDNPFEHKTVEKMLFATYRSQLPPGRKTRTFLRKMARYIEHAWEIGYRDGLAGKPLAHLDDLEDTNDSPLKRGISRRAYTAYCAGHRDALAEKEG